MAELSFNGPYDWGRIIVGQTPAPFIISYSTAGTGAISNLVFTITSTDEHMIIDAPNRSVTVRPVSGWISLDDIKFQNLEYPQYDGDTSNHETAVSLSQIRSDYEDTVLWVFRVKVGSPYDKIANVTITADYTLTIPPTAGDPGPPVVPPTSEIIREERVSQVYTITEVKNLDAFAIEIEELIPITLQNQEDYEESIGGL